MESLNNQYIYLALVISLIVSVLILSTIINKGDLEAKNIKVEESEKGYLALFDNPTGKQKINTGGTNGLYYENNRLYIGDVDLDGNKTYVGETGLVIETGAGTCATLGAASGASGIFRLPAGVNGGTIALTGSGGGSGGGTSLSIAGNVGTDKIIFDSDILTFTGTSGVSTEVTSSTVTFSLLDTGTSGNYGDATNVPVITVDNQGRITSAFTAPISGGGSGGVSNINDLNDAKAGGTNFTDSIKIGSSTTGTLSNAYSNTALGIEALENVTSGHRNVVLGYYAGNSIEDSRDNIFIGTCAGANLTGNSENIGIGYEAAKSLSSGIYNTVVGNQAAKTANYFQSSTYIGAFAGWNFSGNRNTVVGQGVFTSYTGSNNSCLGYQAVPSATATSNEITLGDANITSLRCNVTSITSLSDRRDKKDIIDNPYGIGFIEKIRPVQFTWNKRTGSSINGTKRLGFIAQDLQEAMDENDNDILNLVYDSNPDRLEVTQGNLLPILVKAVQDLKKEVDLLKSRL